MTKRRDLNGKTGLALAIGIGGALALAWLMMGRKWSFAIGADDYDPRAVD